MTKILREIIIAIIVIWQYILGVALTFVACNSTKLYVKFILFPFILMVTYPYAISAIRYWKGVLKHD